MGKENTGKCYARPSKQPRKKGGKEKSGSYIGGKADQLSARPREKNERREKGKPPSIGGGETASKERKGVSERGKEERGRNSKKKKPQLKGGGESSVSDGGKGLF